MSIGGKTHPIRSLRRAMCKSLGGKALSFKILWQGYYLPTMYRDAMDFIRKCDWCQRINDILICSDSQSLC